MSIKEFITTIPVNRISFRGLLTFEKSPVNLLMATFIVALLALFAIGVAVYLNHGHHAYKMSHGNTPGGF